MVLKTKAPNQFNSKGEKQMTRPRYIKEKEVSKITGIALSTLRNNRSLKKGIPYHKFSRSVRYELQEVIDYLETTKIQFKEVA